MIRIIEMNVKVASDDELMRGGSSEREKNGSPQEKQFDLESVDDEGER